MRHAPCETEKSTPVQAKRVFGLTNSSCPWGLVLPPTADHGGPRPRTASRSEAGRAAGAQRWPGARRQERSDTPFPSRAGGTGPGAAARTAPGPPARRRRPLRLRRGRLYVTRCPGRPGLGRSVARRPRAARSGRAGRGAGRGGAGFTCCGRRGAAAPGRAGAPGSAVTEVAVGPPAGPPGGSRPVRAVDGAEEAGGA